MKYKTFESKEADHIITGKNTDDLIQPLFVVAKSVENLRKTFGSQIDKKAENMLSDLEKSIVDMLDTLDKLRMP
ncbi:MAG TPA: hypothetical protein VLB45_00300 [Nitrosopumilaceae archaeon]|nr:hypothetical protein [Nitrosopumilaceae archaeon]